MRAKRNPNLGLSQVRERRRRLFWVRFYIILFFVLFITFTLAILSGHDRVSIKTFLVTGNGAVSSSEILAIAQKDIAGRYFGLFARKNILIFPGWEIERDILEQIKTIKSVDVSWKDWQTVNIEISERKPHSVWCDSECFFVDSHGFIFSKAPTFSGNLFIKAYGDVMPGDIYTQIFYLIELLDKKGIEVVSVNYDKIDFTFTLENGVKIIFNDQAGSFGTAFSNLFTAIESGNLDLLKEENKIDYVDLRTDSKILIGKKNI